MKHYLVVFLALFSTLGFSQDRRLSAPVWNFRMVNGTLQAQYGNRAYQYSTLFRGVGSGLDLDPVTGVLSYTGAGGGGGGFSVASQAQATAGTDNTFGMTPLRTAQAIANALSGYSTTTANNSLYVAFSGSYNNPSWLTALAGSKVSEDATHRWGTDALFSTWNGKEPGLGNPGVNGYLLGSSTSGVRAWYGPSAILDILGNTRGAIAFRGSGGWAILGPGALGTVLTSGGAGADPSYQAQTGGGDATTNTTQTFINKTLQSPTITGVSDSDSTDKATTIAQVKRIMPRFVNFPYDTARLTYVNGNITIKTAAEQAIIDARIAAQSGITSANVNRVLIPVGANTTNINGIGLTNPSAVGTATGRNIANTNAFTQILRIGYVSSATAPDAAGVKTNFYTYSNQNQIATAAFGFSDAATVATVRNFIGFHPSSSIPSSNPSGFVNCLGVGSDVGDANLSFFRNDGSGSAIKTDLGSAFPANTINADYYKLTIQITNGGGSVTYILKNVVTGATSTNTFTTELPASVGLYYHFNRQNGTTALAVGLDFSLFNIRTEF